MTEHDQQSLLFEWASYFENRVPELSLMFAVPNGGKRHIGVAIKMKAEGVKAGVPDIVLPVPRKGFHGMFIEMKNGKKGKVADNQKWWLQRLSEQGYNCVVCYSYEEAKDAISEYLGGL